MTRRRTPFAARIVEWQRRHGRRGLPWQDTRDPYRIWVSEIMLQQTQVAVVIPYFLRFIERFPAVHALAAAPAAAVMAAWSGLGYYSRARNLHSCARAIVERHGGRFPASALQLAQLPGIGRSTAAAIAAFAFGERAAILDGNVKRVLARHFGVAGSISTAVVERQLWVLAEAQLPARGIERYTQGLMDLGATVCTRVRPRCDACPVAATCIARTQGRTEELPLPRAAKPRPVRHTTVAIIRDGTGGLLLEARPPAGVWGGLMSLPEFDAGASDADLARAIAERYALDVALGQRLPAVQHDFSHFRLIMHPRLATVRRTLAAAASTGRLVEPAALDNAALPAPVRRLLKPIDALA